MPARAKHLLISGIGTLFLGALISMVSLGNPHVTIGAEPVGLGGVLRMGLLAAQWIAIMVGAVLLTVGAASWGSALEAESSEGHADGPTGSSESYSPR